MRAALRNLSRIVLALAAGAGASAMTVPAAAETPPLIFQNLAGVRVLCQLEPHELPDRHRLQDELCDRVTALAAEDAPLPVSRIGVGDPAVLAPDTLTLLVHASVQEDRDGRLLVLDIRPFRAAREQSAVLFGAAPRALRIPASGGLGPAIDAALRDALADTLPWRSSH
jgi:hypothetical protein